MSRITMEIPAEALQALRISEGQAEEALRMAAAVKLFELGQLSSGAAASLAGIPDGAERGPQAPIHELREVA
jgi:hypothetical protein